MFVVMYLSARYVICKNLIVILMLSFLLFPLNFPSLWKLSNDGKDGLMTAIKVSSPVDSPKLVTNSSFNKQRRQTATLTIEFLLSIWGVYFCMRCLSLCWSFPLHGTCTDKPVRSVYIIVLYYRATFSCLKTGTKGHFWCHAVSYYFRRGKTF